MEESRSILSSTKSKHVQGRADQGHNLVVDVTQVRVLGQAAHGADPGEQ